MNAALPKVEYSPVLHVTRFPDVQAKQYKPTDTTFEALAEGLVTVKEYPTKESCPLLKLARFGDISTESGCLRHDENVLGVTGAEGDYDGEQMSIQEAAMRLELAGVQAILYTSARHTENAPRWRVLAPVSVEHAPAERAKFVARLNGVLGGVLAAESFSLSQTFYFGRVAGATYETAIVDGLPVDLLDNLDESAIYPDESNAEKKADSFPRAITLRRVDAGVIEDVRDALAHVPATEFDSYTVWVPTVGQALKSLAQAGYEAEALEMWHESSARSDKYDADEAQKKWDGMRPNSITYLSIFELAKKHGWVNPRSAAAQFESNAERLARAERERSKEIGEGALPIPTQRVMTGSEMLDELVLVAEGSRVSYIHTPRRVLPYSEFRNLLAASVGQVQMPDGRQVKKHLLDMWLAHPERKTVQTQTFAPGRSAVCKSPLGELAQNLWVEKARAVPDNWQELAQPFFDHVEYLVPNVDERDRFLDWVAHMEQAPGVLPSTHYLMVAEQTGIGRNWLAYALARMLAGHAALGYDLRGTLNSGFNGQLSQKLLAVVDELHEGDATRDTRQQEQRLKSMLTEETRTINPKYGRQHVEFNCCRFLMLSNHNAALPLAENDRRVIVIQNPKERKPAEYYRALYALLDVPRFGDALAEALRRRDISRFNPGAVAPINDAKRKVIRAGRSELEQAARDIAEQWPSECITSGRLAAEIGSVLGCTVSNSASAATKAGLRALGTVKIAGKVTRVWALRNAEQWEAMKGVEIADEVKKGEREADKLTHSQAGAMFP